MLQGQEISRRFAWCVCVCVCVCVFWGACVVVVGDMAGSQSKGCAVHGKRGAVGGGGGAYRQSEVSRTRACRALEGRKQIRSSSDTWKTIWEMTQAVQATGLVLLAAPYAEAQGGGGGGGT